MECVFVNLVVEATMQSSSDGLVNVPTKEYVKTLSQMYIVSLYMEPKFLVLL